MIEAKQLRIGSKFNGIGMVETVVGITPYSTIPGYEYLITVLGNRNQYKPVDMEPIPLTPDILLRAGFENTYESAYRLKFDHPFNFIGYDFSKTNNKEVEGFRYYGHYINCNHLHHLQNIVHALTGTELLINI